MASMAQTLRHLLEAEGAVFHSAIQAVPLPAVGGGMGVVATEEVEPGTRLAILPFTSMLTTAKARYNLALAEVTLRRLDKAATDESTRKRQLCFTALLRCSRKLEDSKQLRGESHFWKAVEATVAHLKQRLSPTETIASYIVLMASLYRGVHASDNKLRQEMNSIRPKGYPDDFYGAALADRNAIPAHSSAFRYTSENAWMGEWMNALPVAYDNLLELSQVINTSADATQSCLPAMDAPAVDFEWRSALWFARHRSKVAYERAEVVKRYQHCLDVLLCLRELPVGLRGRDTCLTREKPHSNSRGESVAFARKDTCCTLDQFLWGFNTLMSRGFAFDDEIWAMMPWVDYFNYALNANCTMFTQRCSVHKMRRSGNNDLGDDTDTSYSDEMDPKASYSNDHLREEGSVVQSLSIGWEYIFQTVTPISAGEQVCISYGTYSDFECLLWYGFIQRPYLLPTSALAPVSVLDPQSFLFFPKTKHTRLFFEEASINAKELSYLHETLPRLRDENFRRGVFEHFWRQRMATSTKKVGSELEYDKWQWALQKAFAFVFSPLQDADGMSSSTHQGATWMDELVDCYLRTPPVCPNRLVFGSSHSNTSGLQERGVLLDTWCRVLARCWQSLLRATVCNSLVTSPNAQKCTLGVFGPSYQMQAWIQHISQVCRSQLKDKVPSHSSGKTTTFQLSSFQDIKLFVLRAIAWMELYSNYCEYDHYFQAADTLASTDKSSTEDIVHMPPASDVGFSSVKFMSQTASLDAWLLLQYLALEAENPELHLYLNYESA